MICEIVILAHTDEVVADKADIYQCLIQDLKSLLFSAKGRDKLVIFSFLTKFQKISKWRCLDAWIKSKQRTWTLSSGNQFVRCEFIIKLHQQTTQTIEQQSRS